MPIQKLCPILQAERLGGGAFSFLLYAGELARETRPGQFVHIRCGADHLLRRPISVCDVDGECLRIVFEMRGEGTQWLAARREGDKLDLLGPLGHGFNLTGKKLLLAGGGIGAPPLLFAARSAPGECHVFLGFRNAAHALLLPEFEQVTQSVTVTTDDGSLGARGLVGTEVEAALSREKYSAVLACGPKPMLRAVAQAAKNAGVLCQVSMEERMGCGVGACLVCACKMNDGHYRHVCKHGPVFDASEVDWNG